MALRQKRCWGVISGVEEKRFTGEGDKTWDTNAEEGYNLQNGKRSSKEKQRNIFNCLSN
jgi:hypothetical protein